MSSECGDLSLLLITANVGTLFEQPDRLLTPWLDQFCSKVSREQPDFVALHCQEVGGKTFVTGMQHVQPFVDILLKSPELADYSRVRGYLDEDYETKTDFTALGSVYLVHSRVSDAAMWDFSGSRFHPIADKEIKVDNLRQDPFHKKMKYPPDFFPQFPWSRKGHIVTRWRLRNRVLDMVNVHLFHDASNLEAVCQSPSIYVANRCRALKHTLQTIHDFGLAEAPLFIFGDFNFRLDLKAIVDDHFCGTTAVRKENDDGTVKAQEFVDENETTLLTLGKKSFVLKDPFPQADLMQWRKFDKEFGQFPELIEQQITFPPSYPYSEDEGVTREYMKTRPPSWCDRILYNETGNKLIQQSRSIAYGLVGLDAEMGDHKPVFLSAVLPASSADASSPLSSANDIGNSHSIANNKGNNLRSPGSPDSGDGSHVEPPAKRVDHVQPTAGSNLQPMPAIEGALAGFWPLLVLALIYCSTLLLLQYTVDIDISTAVIVVIIVAASVSYTFGRR